MIRLLLFIFLITLFCYLEMFEKTESFKNKNVYIDYLSLNKIVLDDKFYNMINTNNFVIIDEIKTHNLTDMNIVAKGPTAKYIKNGIGINQAIILTDYKYIFVNDLSSFFGIEDKIKNIKYIFLPDYMHIFGRPNKEYKLDTIIKFLKYYNFSGKLFIYQIQTTLNDYKLNNKFIINSKTTTDVPVQLFPRFLKFNSIHIYGYKMGPGYTKHLETILDYNYIFKNINKIDDDILKTKLTKLFNYYKNRRVKITYNSSEPNKTGINDTIYNIKVIKH